MANVTSTTPKTRSHDNSISSSDSQKLIIDESTESTDVSEDKLSKTDVTNVTKDLGLDDNDTADNVSQMDVDEEVVETHNIIEYYTLKLPSVHDVVKQAEAEQETKDEKITRKGKFAKALLAP